MQAEGNWVGRRRTLYNPESCNLCLSSGSHDRAVLLYEYVGKKTVDLQHTEVPDAYRGRGIAKHLAKVKFKEQRGKTCDLSVAQLAVASNNNHVF